MVLAELQPVDTYPFDPYLHDYNILNNTSDSYNSFASGSLGDDESWESPDNSMYSTAVNKQLNFTIYEPEFNSDWQNKRIDLWTPSDTINWITKVAEDKELNCEEIHNFKDVDGYRLRTMTEEKFCVLEPNCGRRLYEAMHNLKIEQGIIEYKVLGEPGPTTEDTKPIFEHPRIMREPVIQDEQPRKRPPGRPRIPGRRNKKQEKKTGRLWEFIRDLLLKPEYCPSLICWEDHDQGVFRFVHSEKVARLWGTIKENPKMTYEKLSRAMRYYYKSKVLQPVLGRRLVYKFGPTATGWKTPNPNFKNKELTKCKF